MAKGFTNTDETTQQPQAERVDYQGKTPEGFTNFAAQASVQQRFQLANELSLNEAEQLLQDAAYLTARRVEQSKASGDFMQRVAGHLVLGNGSEASAKTTLMAQIDSHFVAQEIDPDFFTKSLLSSSSTLLLGSAK